MNSVRQTFYLVLRLIGGIYFLAFASLSVQIAGLSGRQGVMPAEAWLGSFREHMPGMGRFFAHPTVFWWGSGDAVLSGACIAGMLSSLAAAVGLFPIASFILCFLLYLSFYTVTGPFLHFQWDLLLLEAGFLCILAAPVHSFKKAAEPPKALLFLFRFLIFKLMLTSGWCKLASQDETWRTLTALHFHYETQPIPSWISWYFHHLPDTFHRLSVLVMFGVELILPVLIWLGRRARLAAFWGITGLQILIALSGNYGIFNWLTMVLTLSLLDDQWLQVRSSSSLRSPSAARKVIALFACLLIVPVSIYLAGTRWIHSMPRIGAVDRWVAAPLQSWPIIGAYGLFSVMTTERREIVIEGSMDGEHWESYLFKWKPGEVSQKPLFAAPHMPRLDWQMWFAALGTWRHNPWFIQLCRRILEGSPPVLKLIAFDPFHGSPPRYLRASLYRYHFSDRALRQKGQWWRREYLGPYMPNVSLDQNS